MTHKNYKDLSASKKVSVIIPVYNSEKFLNASIESVLNQTYDDIEILAIDDGSTDKSYEILKQYGDRIIIISQTNKGLASALNVGIKNMNGRWLKWLSPDDVLYPDAIKILVDEALTLSENTIIYSNWDLINENGKKLRSFRESNYNRLSSFEFNVRLLDGQQINVNTTLIPYSIFERGCIPRDLKDPIAIDYDFFLRAGILFGTHFHLIQKPLLKYRIHAKQSSHSNIVKTLSYLSIVRNDILSKLDENEKIKYEKTLREYCRKKSLSKKTMNLGLNILKNFMPSRITDEILVLYLNKVRSRR